MRIQKTLKNSLKKAQGKYSTSRRARNIARKRVVHARGCSNNNNNKRRRSFVKCCPKQQKVSDKLEALKSLIPHRVENGSSSGDDDDEIVKAEQLFQETADYIVVLKTQVFVLQKLIEIYDGSKNVKQQQNVHQEEPTSS